MSWTKTLNTKGQYFRKFIQSLKSNTGSVCRNNKNSCHKNSWSLLGTLCFWSHDFTFLSTIIEWEFLIGKKQRAGINIISDIEKLLKWLPVIYTRNKNQWMGWSNRPYSNSKKKLHWKCLLEKGNSGKFCRKSRICSTPTHGQWPRMNILIFCLGGFIALAADWKWSWNSILNVVEIYTGD